MNGNKKQFVEALEYLNRRRSFNTEDLKIWVIASVLTWMECPLDIQNYFYTPERKLKLYTGMDNSSQFIFNDIKLAMEELQEEMKNEFSEVDIKVGTEPNGYFAYHKIFLEISLRFKKEARLNPPQEEEENPKKTPEEPPALATQTLTPQNSETS
jgi:hypothetical protein